MRFWDAVPAAETSRGTKASQANPDSPTLGNAAVINRPLMMAGSHFDFKRNHHVTFVS
jgi:hypothetical protein